MPHVALPVLTVTLLGRVQAGWNGAAMEMVDTHVDMEDTSNKIWRLPCLALSDLNYSMSFS